MKNFNLCVDLSTVTLLHLQIILSKWGVQASCIDAAQMLVEGLPDLEGSRPWVATIYFNPGAEEPHMRMGHPNVTAGYLFVGKWHAAILH